MYGVFLCCVRSVMEKVYALFLFCFCYIFSGTKQERRDASGFAFCDLVSYRESLFSVCVHCSVNLQ
jgi:hypothetical protein